jgi:hypothetical protein
MGPSDLTKLAEERTIRVVSENIFNYEIYFYNPPPEIKKPLCIHL